MNKVALPAVAHRQTARIEAFSDGVFAIAIANTLLALDLRVPHVEHVTAGSLAHAILDEWSTYFAFVLSFATILIMGINHHARMAWVQRVDGLLIFSNGLVLLMIAALAFPTALVGQYLTGPGGTTAVATYALFVLGTSAAWNVFMIALKPERAARSGLRDPAPRAAWPSVLCRHRRVGARERIPRAWPARGHVVLLWQNGLPRTQQERACPRPDARRSGRPLIPPAALLLPVRSSS
jgi:uncharacterized membrane protein